MTLATMHTVASGRHMPSVPARKSIFPDPNVCLEDRKSFKMIKRHLFAEHGMTPQQYRKRCGFPGTYPMVSSNHSGVRSVLVKEKSWQLEHSWEPIRRCDRSPQSSAVGHAELRRI
jgi:predicted transcriptional regulator